MFLTLTTSMSGNKIAKLTKENRETVRKIRKAISEGDSQTLNKLLDPAGNRPGRRPVMSAVEESMIKHRLIYAGHRRFAVDSFQLQQTMGKIAADGRRNR